MKKINLLTVMGISAFVVFLFLLIFIKTESKPLKNQQFPIEKRLFHSAETEAKKYKISVQSCNPVQMSGQTQIKSCCSAASRYLQLQKYQAPIQKNRNIDSLKMNKPD